MPRVVIACAALVLACGKEPAPSATKDAGVRPTVTLVVDADPPDADVAACKEIISLAGSSVRRSFVAKDYHGARQAGRKWLAEVPASCRDGDWHLIAAMLLDSPSSKPVEAPGLILRTRDEALAAAISEPPDRRVLVYVAFVAALGGTTKLPGDACAFVEADVAALPEDVRDSLADEAHYVCGHAALSAGDAATAKARFDAIKRHTRFADLELRQAEAELALGNRKATRSLAKKAAAIGTSRMGGGYANSTDREAIVAAAKAIAR